MRIDIMTLFPEAVSASLNISILGRACQKGILDINTVQIRDYTENRQQQVDDYPYGGGWGCVMMAQPLKSCLDDIKQKAVGMKSRVLYMSPQGKPFNQSEARRLLQYDHLVLVCGHYEGIDERFIEECVDEELSLGDFVLTGGEIAAMAVTDAVCRMVPGVLSDQECYTGESHWDGLLEYPQYTRPETWEGHTVPDVLRGGNQKEIDKWRRKKMLERTMKKRPDMWERFIPGEQDALLLEELKKEQSRKKLTEPVSCRSAVEADIDDILLLLRQAKNTMRKHRLDQWQDGHPDKPDICADILNNAAFVMVYGRCIAGYFSLQTATEPAYDALTDGKWSSAAQYCTLQRVAVASEFRGSGMADMLIRSAENEARSRSIPYIRTDTHRHNEPMKALLKRNGYRYRGNLLLTTGMENGHDPRRQAFDKILK